MLATAAHAATPATDACPPARAGPGLRIAQHSRWLGYLAREPSLVVAGDGTLMVSGYGTQPGAPVDDGGPQTVPRLWRGNDGGASWSAVAVGTEESGARGNSDSSLAVAPDGTVYFASMTFDPKDHRGLRVAVGVSRDGGGAWSWATLSEAPYSDRPWVAVGASGIAHAIWNDDRGVWYTQSADRGQHWAVARLLHAGGGSSHLAAGGDGDVAVRIVPVGTSGNSFTPGADLVLVSHDDGRHWSERPAPGHRQWLSADPVGTVPRWVEPLAWGADGALYLLWNDATGLFLSRSRHGESSWSCRRLASSDGDRIAYYANLVASGRELVAGWFTGTGDDLTWRVARIRSPDRADAISVDFSPPFSVDAWMRSPPPGFPPIRSTAGEYAGVARLHDGSIGTIVPVQQYVDRRFGFDFWRLNDAP
jgi:hypothetical protein